VQLIMLTSVGFCGDAEMVRKSGISVYLTKPIRQAELCSSLLAVMSRSVSQESPQLVTPHTIVEDKRQLDMQILVAEDNETNQTVVLSMLQKFGCRVKVCSNGKEAVGEATEKEYDLILMDCQMPVMDGYQAAKTIRRLEEKKGLLQGHIPIIALTANALEGDREKCLLSGMDDYISKPFKQDVIFKVLELWSHRKPLMSAESLFIQETERGMAGTEQMQGEKLEKNVEKNSEPVDQSVLDTLRDLQIEGQPDILGRIINAFLKSTENLVVELQKAIAAGEFGLMKNGAHSLKSSSANVGAMQLSELSKKLEMMNEDSEFKNATTLVSAIETEFILVKTVLHREISSP